MHVKIVHVGNTLYKYHGHTWARGGGKGGGCTPPEGQKQVPSPVTEKWVPITKKSMVFSILYPLFLVFYYASLLPIKLGR